MIFFVMEKFILSVKFVINEKIIIYVFSYSFHLICACVVR